MSCCACRSIQNCGRLPKYRPSLTAVSALIDRRPFKISVTRPDGTPMAIASRLALKARATSSRFRRRPGWEIGGMAHPLCRRPFNVVRSTSTTTCALGQNRNHGRNVLRHPSTTKTQFGRVEDELIETAQPCGTNDSTASSCVGLNKPWYDHDGDPR